MIRAAMRWHSESFSFQNMSYAGYDPTSIKALWGLPVDPVPVKDPRASYQGGERFNEPEYMEIESWIVMGIQYGLGIRLARST